MKKPALKKSKRFLLNFLDFAKSAIVAGATAGVTAGYQQYQTGSLDFKTIQSTAILAGIGYLFKNVFEGEKRKIMS